MQERIISVLVQFTRRKRKWIRDLRLVSEMIREVTSLLPGLPIVCIGGISERRAGAVIKAGASGVAVISGFSGEEDYREAASRLKGAVLLSLTGIEM